MLADGVIDVAIVGDGQLARGVAQQLECRTDLRVHGPAPRSGARAAAASGAEIVIIATATKLEDVAGDIEAAVMAGSNVIVSAEEAAFPWAVDEALAHRLDSLARQQKVTILGCGLNPGFVFDALVLTLLGAVTHPTSIIVERTVDLSRFGPTVSARLGIGFTPTEFQEKVATSQILGHAGFPQSMSIVARALNLTIDSLVTTIEPIVHNDRTVGVKQHYTALVDGKPWFQAHFLGHTTLADSGLIARDSLEILSSDAPLRCVIEPGISSQSGSQSIIANSIDRVIAARPGWLTVADLEPAHPQFSSFAQPETPTR